MPTQALLLTRNRFLYASRRLVQEASRQGVAMQVCDPNSLEFSLGRDGIEFNGGALPEIAYLRFGAESREAALRSAALLEAAKVRVVNAAAEARVASSKILSSALLVKAGLPVLTTQIVHSLAQFEAAVALVGGYPLVAKHEIGQQGSGVFLLESQRAAHSMVPLLLKSGPLLLQPFVEEAGGSDQRYLVLDGAILAGFARQGAAGDFRANFHRGASVTPQMDEEGAAIALEATKALGLDFAGVDLIQTNEGWRVLEVNASAGFRAAEEACQVNVAGALVAHFCATQ